nr:GFA family protein [Pseudoponticoccus marisrubri]
MFRCHCRDCQRLTGAGHAEMMPLSIKGFSIGADCKSFKMTGGSGQPTFSGFCPNCGSQLTRNSARMSDRIYVHAASLDDPGLYRPDKSIYADAAPDWDRAAIIASD